MRQFSLENEYGQTYSLNFVSTGFLHEPEGLGFRRDYSYARIGNRFVPNRLTDEQVPISGTLVFGTDKPYDAFSAFLRYVRASKQLKLVYTTTAGTYVKDIDFIRCDKTEITDGNLLQVGFEFIPRTPWYISQNETFTIDFSGDDDAVRYPFVFDEAVYKDYSNGVITVDNESTFDAGFTVEFYGPISNPEIAVYQDSEELYNVFITADAKAGETIKYSSKDGDIYCYLEAADGTTTNLVTGFDIYNTNFFKLPVGSSELHIQADSAITQPIMITIDREYRAV